MYGAHLEQISMDGFVERPEGKRLLSRPRGKM